MFLFLLGSSEKHQKVEFVSAMFQLGCEFCIIYFNFINNNIFMASFNIELSSRLQKTDKLTTLRRFKLTTLRRSKLTTPRRSKLTT